jgi:hypothetical protein
MPDEISGMVKLTETPVCYARNNMNLSFLLPK